MNEENQKTLLDITPDMEKELIKAYNEALTNKKEKFKLFGHEWLTVFVKYWIQAVEQKNKYRNPEKKTHRCPDGTIYTWKTKVKTPKSCPLCKSYLKD